MDRLAEPLKAAAARGVPIRLLTTTYTGPTQRLALDWLVHEANAQVAVSYETQATRLHAKAWLFGRGSGFDTAYVGSSTLTNWAGGAARHPGLQGWVVGEDWGALTVGWCRPRFSRARAGGGAGGSSLRDLGPSAMPRAPNMVVVTGASWGSPRGSQSGSWFPMSRVSVASPCWVARSVSEVGFSDSTAAITGPVWDIHQGRGRRL